MAAGPSISFSRTTAPTTGFVGTYADFWNFPTGNFTTPVGGVIPGMCGSIYHGGIGMNFPRLQAHPDDATGLSVVYPVDMPRKLNPNVPLINVSASVRGRAFNVLTTSTNTPAFGVNVLAIRQKTFLGETFQSGGRQGHFPKHGALSGIARNDAGDPTWTNGSIYRDDRTTPTNTPFFSTPSQLGATGSGDFSIDGLEVGALVDGLTFGLDSGDPVEYDFLFESSAFLSGTHSEWFGAGAFYSGNPLLALGWLDSFCLCSLLCQPPTPNLPQPPLDSLGMPAANFRVYQPLDATIVPPATPVYRPCTITPHSVVAGTVIVLSPSETVEWNTAPGGTFQSPYYPSQIGGVAAFELPVAPGPPLAAVLSRHAVRELATRPLVSVTPRGPRLTISTVTIRARDDIWGLDVNSLRIFVNGVDQTAAISLTVTNSGQGAISSAHMSSFAGFAFTAFQEWQFPMSNLIALVPNANTPIRVSVFVRSGDPILPAAAHKIDFFDGNGLPPIIFDIGRNDVIF